MTDFTTAIKQALDTVPSKFRGPGGAIAVLKDGELIDARAWGYADIETHKPLTTETLIPICSITKQMLCGLITDLKSNPTPAMKARNLDINEQFEGALSAALPPGLVDNNGLKIEHLTNQKSGLRDYWALTVLWGAEPEGKFSMEKHIPSTLSKMTSLHFPTGNEFSYCNTNFIVLEKVIEAVTGEAFADLIKDRIFKPASMNTAFIGADTSLHSNSCVGYEGTEATGFTPAVNRIEWAGDAGAVASLNDMIAYEKHIDRSWISNEGWYAVNGQQPVFDDGTPARYGQGLSHLDIEGVSMVRHGGALRGYRLQRTYAPQHRISVVALFNHEAAWGNAADYILFKALGIVPAETTGAVRPGDEWLGNFLDEEARLFFSVARGTAEGTLSITYAGSVESVKVVDSTTAKSRDMTITLDGDRMIITRIGDNRTLHGHRLPTPMKDSLPNTEGIIGTFHCAQLDSKFTIAGDGGMLYGFFEGFLGKGPMHLMRFVGGDVWALSCPRSMDAPAPGEWSIVFKRGNDGAVEGVTVGCWLARKNEYVRS